MFSPTRRETLICYGEDNSTNNGRIMIANHFPLSVFKCPNQLEVGIIKPRKVIQQNGQSIATNLSNEDLRPVAHYTVCRQCLERKWQGGFCLPLFCLVACKHRTAHSCNLYIWEAEVRGSQIQGQSKSLSNKWQTKAQPSSTPYQGI